MLEKAITIKIDAEAASQIESIARLAERPISQVARIMLLRHLAEHGATLAALAKPKINLGSEAR